jgi:hypothetical protein
VSTTHDIVGKLWNLCNVLKDDHHSQPQSNHGLPPRRTTMNPLDHEEQEILEAFEAGTLRSVATAAERFHLSLRKVNGQQGSAHQHSPHQ